MSPPGHITGLLSHYRILCHADKNKPEIALTETSKLHANNSYSRANPFIVKGTCTEICVGLFDAAREQSYLVLFVLTGVRKTRDDGGDPGSRCYLAGIDHN